ncbi:MULTISPECIES: hypothetical protein [Xanthomonas]|uniref:hypothetical protein n=1 Tax=Xanthomonas TaxID=338 RepID=UPI001ADA76AA|nr:MULTISPECIES: hypothetical protein [unclassified Xanthomonas]MBO9873532.1 hypothetical protein [Xanthomonas sp. D-93]WNH45314.1 hypothetical protein PG878_02235 [Xanthomonas sp. A6251]
MTKRVRGLAYRISSHADTRYEIAAAEEFTNPHGKFRLEQDRLTIWPSEDFESSAAAVEGLASYLKAWEMQADLDCGPESLRFHFESAELEETPEIEMPGLAPRAAELHSTVVLSDHIQAHLTRIRYPKRPESFAVSEYVELAHRRWLGYQMGKEPLPSAAYFIYTVLGGLGGRSKKDIAAMLQIDKAVLHKLSELSTKAGGADTVRKFQGVLPPARMLDAERTWLEAMVSRLVRRLGEYTAGAELERLTMADLPELP